jgi:hypothetical protein
MFYTSVVLFSGFSVFMLSDFEVPCPWWINRHYTSFGMLSNLMLLPCLLTLNKSLTNKQEFIEPKLMFYKPEKRPKIR